MGVGPAQPGPRARTVSRCLFFLCSCRPGKQPSSLPGAWEKPPQPFTVSASGATAFAHADCGPACISLLLWTRAPWPGSSHPCHARPSPVCLLLPAWSGHPPASAALSRGARSLCPVLVGFLSLSLQNTSSRSLRAHASLAASPKSPTIHAEPLPTSP